LQARRAEAGKLLRSTISAEDGLTLLSGRRRHTLCISEAARLETANFDKELVSENWSYRKRMAQKSFTMWPRMKSSMASTVSFLTASDTRFILGFLGFVFGRQNSCY